MLFMGFMLGLLGFALFTVATRCPFSVEEGHCAVLVTFGRAETSDGKKRLVTYGPGLHWKKPWQKAITVSMKDLGLDADEGGGRATNDGPFLHLDAVLRYMPVEEFLYDRLFGIARSSGHVVAPRYRERHPSRDAVQDRDRARS